MEEHAMASALSDAVTDELDDPRSGNATLHPLENIVFIAVYATVCGADNWVAVEQYGIGKRWWFENFLDLSEGIPSHDTFGRIFGLLAPNQVRRCFFRWTRTLVKGFGGQIAIDGKTLRRSFEASDPQSALHVIGAWVDEQDVMLMGPSADNKDEIGAAVKLLDMLDFEDTTITMDALFCQHKIARKIIANDADYLLRVRGNQGNLHDAIREFFDWQLDEQLPADQQMELDSYEQTNGGHGRIETRQLWCTDDIDWLETNRKWSGLSSIAYLKSIRETDGEIATKHRYYICSDEEADAQQILEWARNHWGIENKAHWVLDVQMNEDQSRIRKNHAAENMAMLRRMAMNLLKRDDTLDVGLKNKQHRASCDHDYFLHLLSLADENL